MLEIESLFGLHDISLEESFPALPFLDTQEIIDNMPKGKWVLPGKPYKNMDQITPTDPEFMMNHKIERCHDFCRGIMGEWVQFLNNVEIGQGQVKRVREEGVISGDRQTVKGYSYFLEAVKPKFVGVEDNEKVKEIVGSTIDSCRKAFLFLLTEE
jgi:hypothetical protein